MIFCPKCGTAWDPVLGCQAEYCTLRSTTKNLRGTLARPFDMVCVTIPQEGGGSIAIGALIFKVWLDLGHHACLFADNSRWDRCNGLDICNRRT